MRKFLYFYLAIFTLLFSSCENKTIEINDFIVNSWQCYKVEIDPKARVSNDVKNDLKLAISKSKNQVLIFLKNGTFKSIESGIESDGKYSFTKDDKSLILHYSIGNQSRYTILTLDKEFLKLRLEFGVPIISYYSVKK
jgi:hypothetical protein